MYLIIRVYNNAKFNYYILNTYLQYNIRYDTYMKVNRKFLRIILIPIVILGTCYALFVLSKSRTFQVFGILVNRIHTNDKIVALTFDDAPNQHTDEVLKILNEKNIKATFYIIGESAKQYPEKLQDIVTNEHEVGNHSYTHQRMILKTPAFIKNEIENTNTIIRNAGYKGEITFRPPNGKKLFLLPWYLNQHHIKTMMWDIEPDTYIKGDKDKITEYVLTHIKPGSIILMHPFCDSCGSDREAIPEIIDSLKNQGYQLVTVSELIKHTTN